jgi:hypothetical protein
MFMPSLLIQANQIKPCFLYAQIQMFFPQSLQYQKDIAQAVPVV